MKCCGGKGKGSDNGIQTEMKEIKVPAFDDLFKNAAAALQSAEDFRSGLQDTKAACMALSGAYTLKTGGMADALTLFMWSCGHTVGIEKVSPKLDLENEPHFNIEVDPSMSDEHKEFIEAFKLFCETVVHAPENMKSISDQLQQVTDQANELKGTAKEECTNAGLGAMDTAKAISSIAANIAALGKGASKMAELGPIAAEALTDLKDIASKLATTLADAQTNCKEGGEKGAKTMPEFCEKQHTGEKLAAAQAKNDQNVAVYNKRKTDGKKFGGGVARASGASAASAGSASAKVEEAAAEEAAAPAAEEPAKVEDVVPEVAEVMDA